MAGTNIRDFRTNAETSMPKSKTIPAGTPSFLLGMTGEDDSDIGEYWLPIDLVTQTIGIVAKKRTGKSYLAKKLTEGLLDLHQQVCVIDPKGDWWGLRSSADGKHDGYPVVIFGGEHGDVPLEVGGGEIVAKFVVDSGTSVVLDLSRFRKHEVATFMTAFLEAIYLLKAQEANRTPLMLVVDESDAIASQKPQPNEARMLGAMQDIVRRGGQRGIGCTMITQRTAVLNKDVLTQCQVLIALRTISPQDLKAMNEWIDVHGTPEERKTLMASLPSLPIGQAWVWSPGWPDESGIFERIQVSRIRTYDSGATPKPGEKRTAPKVVKAIDLDKLRTHMAATIEEAKANDPKELRKQVAELTKKLAGMKITADLAPKGPTADEQKLMIDRAVSKAIKSRDAQWRTAICDGHKTMLAALMETFKTTFPPNFEQQPNVGAFHMGPGSNRDRLPDDQVVSRLTQKMRQLADRNTVLGPGQEKDTLTPLLRELNERAASTEPPPGYTGSDKYSGKGRPRETGVDPTVAAINSMATSPMSAPHRKILTVLAQHSEHHNSDAMPHERCAIRAGYSYSGGFRNYLSELRGRGWIMNGTGGIYITMDGLKALGAYDSLPTGADLLYWWRTRVSAPEGKILNALDRHRDGLSGAQLAQESGYEYSGGFRNYISSLRTKGLIVGKGGELIRLHEDLT